MTPMEGRGLLRGGGLLFALALIRLLFSGTQGSTVVPDGGGDRLPALIQASQETRSREARRAEPLAPGELVDPNRSGEDDLDRLPGVGPAVAAAIARHRVGEGGFARPEDLLLVPGIGPATLARIRPHLDFSLGVPVQLRGGGSAVPIDLNRATQEELERLPGIGPAIARRILESRARDGPFEKGEDLMRVQGIGPVILSRILPLVRAGRIS